MLETRRGALLTSVFVAFWCLTIFGNVVTATEEKKGDLVVLTPYRKESDGLARFLRSAKLYGYKIKVLGEEKAGEDAGPGDEELLANSVLSAGPVRVVEEFERSGAAVLVSADGFCWPDRELEGSYPKVKRGKRFLNSGGIVGRAEHFYRVLSEAAEEKSLQMLLTHAYIKDATRDKSCWDDMITLDASKEEEMPAVALGVFVEKETPFLEEFLEKISNQVYPKEKIHLFVHNSVNYHEEGVSAWAEAMKEEVASVKYTGVEDNVKEWHARNAAIDFCLESESQYFFSVDSEAHIDNPYTIKLLIEQNRDVVAPMLIRPYKAWSNFWGAITSDGFYARSMDYMEIVQGHRSLTNRVLFLSLSSSPLPLSRPLSLSLSFPPSLSLAPLSSSPLNPPLLFLSLFPSSLIPLPPLSLSFSRFLSPSSPHPFSLFSSSSLPLPLPPSLPRPPSVSQRPMERALHHLLLPRAQTPPGGRQAACLHQEPARPRHGLLREPQGEGVFMYVSNRVDFGHLVNADQFDSSRVNPELWQVVDNRWDWEQRYLHPNYSSAVAENATAEMPCPDVYWFPLFKERYAQEMIQTFEDFGVWSAGTNDDPRLEGGYESVPTIDIHMKQIGMEAEWLEILRVYVQPMQLKVFEGYYNDVGPPRAIMNFMVRYKPDEQPFLRPHHDTSTYTINVALNKPGVDYKGGGCRFVRYNCSVTDSRVGWILMHPGRLTHLHEGLPTTEGTRYIIVSFVDP
ncbi:putative Procollagen-lysine,2-oxoglutarate 5-dioxygenase 3 precursor [Penaeus vannamei]|uniref:procollagen-lysine 5-dioxygenase n=1 Tax=Penaeus vannamei TaxID=6689 RepID=A0A423U6K4_PENVA|nr:putative Procollagen-lysine,2-oxoglutarate 5-dioxygenase 3 precursor [Penaeus vannamei]